MNGSRTSWADGRPLRVDLQLWAVVLVILAFPVGLQSSAVLGPIDPVQLVAACAVAVVALLNLLDGRAPLRWHPGARWAVALILVAAVAAATARDVFLGARQVIALSVAVALALAVNTACRRPRNLRLVVLLLAVVGAGVCLHSLGDAGELQASAAGAGAVGNRPVGIFAQPNELGTFSAMFVFIGAALALGARRRLELVVGVVTALSAVASLALSLSRGAWVGTVVAMVVLAVLSRRGRRAVLVFVVAFALIGAPVLQRTVPETWQVLQGRVAVVLQQESNPDDARDLIYVEAVRQITDRPITGQGPANFRVAAQTVGSSNLGVNAVHAHSVMLTVAAELGLLGAAALLAFTVSVARHVLRVRSSLPPADRDLLLGLSCALVALVAQGLVDFTLRNPVLLMLVWFVVGLVFAASDPRVEPGPPPGRTVPARSGVEAAA